MQHVGADCHERTEEHSGHGDGHRSKSWNTRVGAVELKVPQARDGVATSPRRRGP